MILSHGLNPVLLERHMSDTMSKHLHYLYDRLEEVRIDFFEKRKRLKVQEDGHDEMGNEVPDEGPPSDLPGEKEKRRRKQSEEQMQRTARGRGRFLVFRSCSKYKGRHNI